MKHFCIPHWLYYIFAIVIVGALIWHWQHVLTYAPFLFLLACPLMHLFHGHGHGSHDHSRKDHAKRVS